MIVNYWPEWFRSLYGGGWPQSYCCVDVETTGFSFDRDVIWEWGHCLVLDGKIEDRLSLVIDWSTHPTMRWNIDGLIDRLQRDMCVECKPCSASIELMKKNGMPAEEALSFIRKFTRNIKARNIPFVVHNFTFDEKMICSNLSRFGEVEGFSFGDNGFIDTDGIEKASQLVTEPKFHPVRSDTLRSYFHRVRYARANGLKSNLDQHCFEKYDFKKHGISKSDMHGAEMDAYCCHLLMEEYRSQLKPHILTPPLIPLASLPVPRKVPVAQAKVPVGVGHKRVRGQRNS